RLLVLGGRAGLVGEGGFKVGVVGGNRLLLAANAGNVVLLACSEVRLSGQGLGGAPARLRRKPIEVDRTERVRRIEGLGIDESEHEIDAATAAGGPAREVVGDEVAGLGGIAKVGRGRYVDKHDRGDLGGRNGYRRGGDQGRGRCRDKRI